MLAEHSALPLMHPAWPALPGVGAAMSTRGGGCSHDPFDSLNLGVAVGDMPGAVARNRARFARALGARPVWLRQVHGAAVRRLMHDSVDAADDSPADAAWTSAVGVACTVQVADCLPVLMASRDGRAVAAAHAGWRGLARGVLDATLAALKEGADVSPPELQVWLGPCIGPRQFEVGADVLAAFGVPTAPGEGDCPDPARHFQRRSAAGGDGRPRWLADLPGLARARLQTLGVPDRSIHSAAQCTVEQPSDFFSFRREQARGLATGRLAAAIWRQA